MTIPVLVPPVTPELTVPYLTPGQFTSYPTWLDLDNLIPGGVAALQADELADVLLTASTWAVGVADNMPLHAHWVQNEQQTIRTKSSNGRVHLRPRDIPVRAITSLSWGFDPAAMFAATLPDSSMRIEDGRRVSWLPGGTPASFTGPAVQFGPVAAPETQVYATWSYVAGYPNTVMPSGVTANATSVTVADPAGILPGDVLRIYDDPAGSTGLTEAVTVAATYAPALPTVPPTATAIPLATGTTVKNTHAAGVGITGFPRKILQAVVAYTVALLMREDVASEAPVSGFGPAARTTGGGRGGQAAGLVNDALGWLAPYRPTWRPG